MTEKLENTAVSKCVNKETEATRENDREHTQYHIKQERSYENV